MVLSRQRERRSLNQIILIQIIMTNWFEVKARYSKMQESGIDKVVTESYLVEAVSFTDAEATAVEELTPYMSGEFEISAVGKKKFAECFFNETGEKYYRMKLYFITLDEKSGTEKKSAHQMLVQADTLMEALLKVENEMEKSMIDYYTASATETAIIDVVRQPEETKKPRKTEKK